MKFLLTGSAGFIGFHLASVLLDQGHEIIGVDSMNDYYDPLLKEKRNEILITKKGYTFINLDIAETKEVSDLVARERPDQIIHLAAQAGVRYSLINPFAYERSNVLGTLNMFEAARHHGIKRVIYASSSSVYGANTKIPFAESDMTDAPVSLYAATKKSCELIAHTYHHLYGIEMAGLRFFTVYGTYYRPDMALFLFAKKILTDQSISVFNHGKMKRDFTHVSDIVDGIVGVIQKEQLADEIYNLGGDHPIELETVISLLEKELGKPAVKEYKPMQPGDVVATYADITKARAELGFQPKMSIEQGIAEYCAWFLANKEWLLRLK
jgi:UDP-glucuronate 4-epimerase